MAAITNLGATFSLTDVANSLKIHYLPTFRANIKDPNKHYMMNAIEEGGYESISGKSAVYALQIGYQGGAGALAEGANYKSPSTYNVKQQTVLMKNLQAVGAIDLKTMHAGANGGGFEDILAKQMSTLLEAAQADKARQFFTPSSGLITSIPDAFTPTANDSTNLNWSVNLDLSVDSTDRLNIGYRIDIYNSDTLYAQALQIVDIDEDNSKITVCATSLSSTLPSTTTPVDIGEFDIYIDGSKGEEIEGLEGAVGATTGTYHGIDRATNKWYLPAIKTLAADTPLNEKALRSTYDKVDKRGSGNVTLMCSTHEAVSGYEAELMVFKRYTDHSQLGTELTGGYSHLLFDGKPILRDRDATHQKLYGIDKQSWYKPTYQEYTFDDFDGSLFKFTAGQKYDFRMYEFSNLTTDAPRSNFVIGNISEDEADFS